MLSDDEIKAIDIRTLGCVHFAREIEAAVLAKLRAGVELPEVDLGNYSWNLRYTKDQLLSYGDTRDQAGYLRGLEDAKRVCEAEFTVEGIAQRCATAIDKLKGKP